MGIDEVSLDLLEHQKQDNEPQRLPGIVHQHQKRTHGAADERPYNGDQGGQCDQNAHQQCVGEMEQGHGHKKHGAQDHGLQTLTGEKAGKGPFTEPQNIQKLIRGGFRQKGVAKLTALPGQLFLLQQDVQRKDQADEKGSDAADDAADQSAAGDQKALAPVLDQPHGLLGKTGPVDRQPFDLVCQKGQVFLKAGGAFLQALKGFRYLRRDRGDSVPHAGDDHHSRQRQHCGYCRNGEQQRQRAAELIGLFCMGKQAALQRPHGDIENKGDGTAQQQRGQNAQQPPGGTCHHIQMQQRRGEGDAAADNAQQGFHGLLVEFHMSGSFR